MPTAAAMHSNLHFDVSFKLHQSAILNNMLMKSFWGLFCTLLFITGGLLSCKKTTEDAEGKILTDPDEISKVLIIPDAERIKGAPPTPQNGATTTQLTAETSVIAGISGQEMTLTYKYNYTSANKSDEIEYILLQLDGSSSYFKIPVTTVGRSGTIYTPLIVRQGYELPQNTYQPRGWCMQTYATTYGGACIKTQSPSCISSVSLPPRGGTGKSTINGKTYDASAACDIAIPGFQGKAFVIKISDTKFIALYNMTSGNHTLKDFSDLDLVNDPFALYYEDGKMYYSKTGYATIKSKTVSVTSTMEDLLENSTKTVSAIGTCE